MAARGYAFRFVTDTHLSVEDAVDSVVGAVIGVHGYTVHQVGRANIVISRRFIPTWAIITGVILLLFFLLGLLLFLVRKSETATVHATHDPVSGMTTVRASGTATVELQVILRSTFDDLADAAEHAESI